MQTEQNQILILLERISTSYSRRHADDYLACFAEPAIVYGTGVDEKCVGTAEIRAHLDRDWSQSASASFTLETPQVEIMAGTAWVISDCRFDFCTDAGEGHLPGRVTFILGNVDGQWRIRHAHFSVPTGVEGSSFPTA